MTGPLFAQAPYHEPRDPLARVLAYIDFRRALLDGDLAEITCLAGTLVQETYREHPSIRDACAKAIFGHIGTLVDDIEQAMTAHGVPRTASATTRPQSDCNHHPAL